MDRLVGGSTQPIRIEAGKKYFARSESVSSSIRSVGYDAGTQALDVEFASGQRYRYLRVPAEVFAALMATGSLGTFVNTKIKPVYEFEKL